MRAGVKRRFHSAREQYGFNGGGYGPFAVRPEYLYGANFFLRFAERAQQPGYSPQSGTDASAGKPRNLVRQGLEPLYIFQITESHRG
jgi:hypothetical protein